LVVDVPVKNDQHIIFFETHQEPSNADRGEAGFGLAFNKGMRIAGGTHFGLKRFQKYSCPMAWPTVPNRRAHLKVPFSVADKKFQ